MPMYHSVVVNDPRDNVSQEDSRPRRNVCADRSVLAGLRLLQLLFLTCCVACFGTKSIDITESQRESRRHQAAGRVGERTTEGSGLGLGPAGSNAGAMDSAIKQVVVICTLLEDNLTTRVRYPFILLKGRLVYARGTKSVRGTNC